MATIEFVPFCQEHLNEIGEDLPEWSKEGLVQSQGWTMLADGKATAAAGLCLLWPGVAEAWQVGAPDWGTYYLKFWGEIRRRLPKMIEEMGLWRVQTACLALPQFFKWAKVCGFKLEGPLEKYGLNGENYLRLAKVV
jgi:hypothetical protein